MPAVTVVSAVFAQLTDEADVPAALLSDAGGDGGRAVSIFALLWIDVREREETRSAEKSEEEGKLLLIKGI